MSNVGRAARLLETLAARGVATVCSCPGGRNAPLIAVLDESRGFERFDFYDERGAAFFALGRARVSDRPVAVLTTSGTAVAELLPAAIEARHAGLPLILVTADRPPALRGTGAPQAIVQPGLFGAYAPTVFDGATDADQLDLSSWDGMGPVHVNICFDEPLLDAELPRLSLSPRAPRTTHHAPDTAPILELLTAIRHPLVILGALQPDDHDGVRRFLLALGAPFVADPSSGLREDPALASLLLAGGDRSARHAAFDGVLRVGGVPTLRRWRDLDRDAIPVCSVSPVPLPGLARGALLVGAPGQVLGGLTPPARRTPAAIEAAGRRQALLDAALDAEPASEPGMLRALSRIVPDEALVYLGNSLPIREWDLAAVRDDRRWRTEASRGANGIDGQVSTFLGMCTGERDHWAVLGDLTTLYDLGAPWILPRLPAVPIRIVVVNNGGGQIFGRLFDRPSFVNAHDRTFKYWARMWGVHYEAWTAVPAVRPSSAVLPSPAIIELRPDPAATARFWAAYDATP